MASLEFRDARGERWQVWEVHPDTLERRIAADPHLRPPKERRRTLQSRVHVSDPAMVRGWLTFESAHEKRRLSPIPDGWAQLDDAALANLLAQAHPAGRPRRLIE